MKPQEIARDLPDAVISLDAGDLVRDTVYGRRAAKLALLTGLGLPVPPGVALSFTCVRALADGGPMPSLPLDLVQGRLLSLRASPEVRAWGGAAAILNIGLCDRALPALAAAIGGRAAHDLHRRFIAAYAAAVEGLDPEDFEALIQRHLKAAGLKSEASLSEASLISITNDSKVLFARELGMPFPEDPLDQLEGAARSMARAWNATSARILRQAKGAPADAGVGLVVQEVALGLGRGVCGEGQIQMVDSRTGAPVWTGGFTPQGEPRSRHITRDARLSAGDSAPSLEELSPSALAVLQTDAHRAAHGLGEVHRFEFSLSDARVSILDATPVRRNARASVRIAVDLANIGAITREEALLRVEPRNLIEHLHPQIDPAAARDVFGTGLAASPGAATGRIVFTAEAAQAAAASDEATILVRLETSPEDIRGMHAARGVLTIRGGMTSHAAVIARGIGLPCVVGAGSLRLDFLERTLATPDGRVLREGALVTLDGTRGEVMAGAPAMIPPELGGAFSELLEWADAVRDLGVRANADTPAEARMAREFRVDGIGLCRTEHMFFDVSRIMVMREMILADTETARRAALARLLPMQRADFQEIFEIMRGLPVTIRLLDPPLHEFLPREASEIEELAEAMGMAVSQVRARARELSEVNPMLGMRGVRLAVTMPEIYEMQARAIFEAAIAVNRDASTPVVPEVMIPLVSANREVELVKRRVDAIAAEVEREQGIPLTYKLGVMVETPRAALRAGDLASSSAFLSFGTNDLTQMTYGLSRDDAGRFMRDYVNQGVFPEDPFHSLDLEGVGELMLIAARRGRAENPGLVLGLCGEHGGDPSSVRFCKVAGFDYVSCSPYRVPIARLAAAQATILALRGQELIPHRMRPIATDLNALRLGGKAALAQVISALETKPYDAALLSLLDAACIAPQGLVLGLTGPPGVGKSTLTSAFVSQLRTIGQSVGVIAVDPSSRHSGGALLGDRTRIVTDPGDAGVFIRSMAARRRLGGVADATYPASVLMRAVFDWVIVETVGVGQSETDIADCADLVVLCVQPGAGDALQFMKAGVMEVPDVVLVTKGDMGAEADRAATNASGALSIATAKGSLAAVGIVSARSGKGVAEAVDLIVLRALELRSSGELAERRHWNGCCWLRNRLIESIGTVGFSALESRFSAKSGSFAGLEMLVKAAEKAVHDSLKNI